MEYIPSVEQTPIYVRPWDVPQSTHIHGGALSLRGKISATIMLRQPVLTDTCDQHGYSQNAEQQRRIAHQRHGMAFSWRSSTQKMQVIHTEDAGTARARSAGKFPSSFGYLLHVHKDGTW